MVTAAVILQKGKVELREAYESSHGVPLRRMRMMMPARPMFVSREESEKLATSLDIATVYLDIHRMYGCSVEYAYWPINWADHWAIEELLKWEGREDEIRRDHFYSGFIHKESNSDDQSGSSDHGLSNAAIESSYSNRRDQAQHEPLRAAPQVLVLESRGSVYRRSLDTGPDVPG